MIVENKLMNFIDNFFKWSWAALMIIPAAPAIFGIKLFVYLSENKSNNLITAFLKSMESKNKDIKKIAENYSSIKEISVNKIYENEKLAKEFNKLIDRNDSLIILQMCDKNNQAIAYSIFNQTRNQEKIYISPKYSHSKEVIMYIAAKFEIKAEIYGDGLRYVVKNSKKDIDDKKLYSRMQGNPELEKSNTEYVSKEEYKKLCSECQEMVNIIISTFESKMKSLGIGVQLDPVYDYNNPDFYNGKSMKINYQIYLYLSDNKDNFLETVDLINSENYKKFIGILKEILNTKLGYSDDIENIFINGGYAINSKKHEKFKVNTYYSVSDYSSSEYSMLFTVMSKKSYKFSKTSYNEVFSKIEFL